MSEASPEVTTVRYLGALEKDNLHLQKELERVEAEVWKACHYRNKPLGGCFFLFIVKKDKTVFWEPVGERSKEVNSDPLS